MNPLKISAITAAVCLILLSCANSGNSKEVGNDINIKAVINSQFTDPNVKGDNKCLLDYQQKYDALLTESDVIAATGFSAKTIETKYNKALKNPEHHGFKYKFKNGRKGKVKGLDMEMELPDVVEIKTIKSMSLSTFKQNYSAVADEEIKAAKDVLDKVVDGKSGDANAEAALKNARAHDVSKEQIKEIGGGIMDVMKEVSRGYRTVNGLGDAARWNVVSNELYVLQNGVQFVIFSEVGKDHEKNKSIAIQLAEIILDKCK